MEKVTDVDNTNNPDDSERGDEADTCRYVATKVVVASCECQSGAGGGCHHVCQLLQLTRLLQLTEVELATWNPKSPTSVACHWVLKHCGAGRSKEHNIMHRVPMQKIAQNMRTLRDPKKHPFTGGEDEAVETRGVVAMDRAGEYSAHPDYGVWADKKRRYETGDTLSQSAYKKFAKFVDSQRKEYKRETSLGVTLESIKSKVCIDVLPPRVG